MLLGEFSINLFNYNTDKKITQFIDELYSNYFIPYINQESGHLMQFLIEPSTTF